MDRSTLKKGALIVVGVLVGYVILTQAGILPGDLIPGQSGGPGGTDGLPKGESQPATVEVEKDGEFVTMDVMETDGVKHSVPLEEIRTVLGKDGIPSIDDPEYYSPQDALDENHLTDEDPGLLYEQGDTARFYPYNILVWHEIVNDTIEGQDVLITYCPLCLSGIVFDPLVKGERVEFGTSGKLWNSNLVMYDRKTESYWSQVLGEAIVGPMTGTKLEVLPSNRITFGAFRSEFPDGEVLNRNTGTFRSYGNDPYGGYYTDNSQISFPVNNTDDRLENKDFVLGVVEGDQAKAYEIEAVKRDVGSDNELRDTFAGRELILRYDHDIDVVKIFEELPDGSEERVNPFPNFWFSWAAAHPETEVYN